MRLRLVVVILATCSAVATQALLAGDRRASAPDVLCMKGPRYASDAPAVHPRERGMVPGRTPQWCPIPELADAGVDDD